MYNYSSVQWLFLFFTYCFIGWIWETSYVSIKKRNFVNRGFMRGPFLPIYGSGCIVMLIATIPFGGNLVACFFSGMILATILEYFTGAAMEALFKIRYWDYSNNFCNLNGHICLKSSLAWGAFTIILTEVLHKPVERMMYYIPEAVLTIFTHLLSIAIAADFALSFKAAIDLRDILIKMEEAKADLQRLSKRVDVVIAFANEEMEERKENAANKIKQLEERYDELRARMLRDFYMKSLIRNNPDMHSDSLNHTLEEIKKILHK